MIAAALLAAAALATAQPASAPTMMQLTLPSQDIQFLQGFLATYAGQGCSIQTQQAVQACEAATRALDVWKALSAATPVPQPIPTQKRP